MAIEFKLPEVSEGVTSVDIAEVKVAEGDVIEAGAAICEVETDKAVAEINCPHAGRISRVLVKTGQKVPIGQVLVVIEAADPASGAAKATAPTPAAASNSKTSSTPQTPSQQVAAPSAGVAATIETGGVEKVVEFLLPEVSEGVKTVDVASVNVKTGEVISAGAAVCEVETDKAVAEINCPHGGTVTAVHVKPGTTIPIGEPLISIRTLTAASGRAVSSVKAPDSAPAAASQPVSATPRPAIEAPSGKATETRAPAPAGPATRRLARKLGVDLHQVKGTAGGGRITIDDVEAYVRERLKQAALPAAASAPGFGIVAAAPLPDFSKFGPIEKQPMNKIFRVAAASLHTAWVTIPHVTQHDLADITELESARKRYVKSNPNAPKITMTAIMIKAVVGALKAYPNVNSSVDMQSGELIIKHYYHIGVAVDTPNGLVVPVIRNCDQKNVLQVASELTDVAVRARDRKLKTEEMQGATFTITNLGGIGGTAFTPIVNYPEVAILGLSRGINQLVLEDGQVSERLMLPLSLSYDHRAINGADAARFIVKLSSSLSNFFELF